MRFNIGDKVWTVGTEHYAKRIPCPDCQGQKAVTVILGDGSQVSVDCGCGHGYDGPRGYVEYSAMRQAAKQRTVTGMEIDGAKVEYKLDGHSGGGYYRLEEKNLFATKEEAEARLVELLKDEEDAELRKLNWQKEDNRKTWAWNVNYHRRCLKEAQRNLDYHSRQLAVAKTHAKAPELSQGAHK